LSALHPLSKQVLVMLGKRTLTTDNKPYTDGQFPEELFICFCFAAGCLMGAFTSGNLIGTNKDLLLPLDLPLEDGGILLKILKYIRFHILALFLGTSLTGVVLIPALAVVRGFVLSFASAFVLASSKGGLLMCLTVLGLPTLFSIPCFILFCEYGAGRSRRLIALANGRGPGFYEPGSGTLFIALPVLIIGAVIDIWLVPKLVLMIN